MTGFDTGTGILIEEIETLEQLARRRANHALDVGRGGSARNEKREVELRGWHRGERSILRNRRPPWAPVFLI